MIPIKTINIEYTEALLARTSFATLQEIDSLIIQELRMLQLAKSLPAYFAKTVIKVIFEDDTEFTLACDFNLELGESLVNEIRLRDKQLVSDNKPPLFYLLTDPDQKWQQVCQSWLQFRNSYDIGVDYQPLLVDNPQE